MTPKLTIAIDARWIFPALSGVGVYTRNLIRHLSLLDDENRYFLLFDDPSLMKREILATGAAERRNFSAELLPYSVFSLRNQVELPRRLKRLGIDLFHSPNFMIPLRMRNSPQRPRRPVAKASVPMRAPRRIGLERINDNRTSLALRALRPLRFLLAPAIPNVKTIVTIHDLIPLLFPHYTGRSKKRKVFPIYRRIMRRVARNADAIMADSDCTRNDILSTLDVPGDKVRRVYLGVDEMFSPGPSTGKIKRRFGISGRLLLCVGRQDPYKNVLTAVKVLKLVAERRKDLNCRMLIVGKRDPRYPEVSEYISRENLPGKVITADYLNDDDLVAAYREADLLVHLSLYEGFGLPPLEAMACGTPVVSSDRPSLPEVLGDAALFTNPYDVPGTALLVSRVLTDERLRRQLIMRGRERAAKFTWNETASNVIQIYREVAR